jgi:hypothetical protein
MKRKMSTLLLAVVTCAVSFLRYITPYEWHYSINLTTGQHIPTYTFDVFVSILWVMLLVATLIVGQWNRKLFWLFALFPIAFAPWLLLLYFALSYGLRSSR